LMRPGERCATLTSSGAAASLARSAVRWACNSALSLARTATVFHRAETDRFSRRTSRARGRYVARISFLASRVISDLNACSILPIGFLLNEALQFVTLPRFMYQGE